MIVVSVGLGMCSVVCVGLVHGGKVYGVHK